MGLEEVQKNEDCGHEKSQIFKAFLKRLRIDSGIFEKILLHIIQRGRK